MNPPPNLCYTLALDRPGKDAHWRMARLLVTSLLRTQWHGRIVVFRNLPRPVLPDPHPAVEEVLIEADLRAPWDQTMSLKYRLRHRLDLTGIGKVLFLDCDCLALRNLNHLMLGSWDLYVTEEPGRIVEFPFFGYLTEVEMAAMQQRPGINAGVFGIRASRFHEVLTEWERLDQYAPLRPYHGRDQHSWNRLLLDTPLRQRAFTRGEVQFPFLHRALYCDYRQAALVHAANRTPKEKLALLYGLWMETFGQDRLEGNVVP